MRAACGVRVRPPPSAEEFLATRPCLLKANLGLGEYKRIVERMKRFTTDRWSWTLTVEELDALPTKNAADLTRFNALSVDLKRTPLVDVDKARAELQASVDKEKSCRADAKCMGARAEVTFEESVVTPMCVADKERETAVADLAHERANPSGVVDLNRLHMDGEEIQTHQSEIAALVPQYVAFRHHPWRGWRSECH
jgi:hypothetical protein